MQGLLPAVFGDQRDLARLPEAAVRILLMAFSLLVNAAKGISILQLSRRIEDSNVARSRCPVSRTFMFVRRA
jgi:hypothetical protein